MIDVIKRLLAPPLFESEEKRRTAYILNVVLLTMLTAVIVVGSMYMLVQISTGVQTVLFLFVRLSGGLLLLYFLMRKGYVRLASIGLTLLFLWFGYFLLPQEETLNSPFLIAFILPIVMAGLLLGGRGGVMTAVVSIAILTIYASDDYDSLSQLLTSLLPFFGGIYISVALLLRLAYNSISAALDEVRQSNQALQQINAVMENKVAERTRDLALAADIGRTLTQVRDVEDLLAEAASSVQGRFNLYYVQIYLIDAAGQNLVMRAGTGTVGQELRQRGHSLPLNAASINGTAVVNREAVIVADTAVSPAFRPNSLLPDTRSEMAVPLIVGEKVVGVLDLQSSQPQALSAENLGAFEILAGQLAIAIENARLIRDTNRARAELEARIQQSTRVNWDRYLDAIHRGERIGYRYEYGETSMLDDTAVPSSTAVPASPSNINVPIIIGGESFGTVEVLSPVGGFVDDDLEMVSSVARLISQQIENLRLLDEAEQYRQEAEAATRRMVREGWEETEQAQQNTSFVYDQTAVLPLAEIAQTQADIVVPLAVQGESIGWLELAGVAANDAEVTRLATAVAARLSAHLENLRLSLQTEDALSQAKQRTAELNILNEMGAAFTSARETEEMLRLIRAYTSRLISKTENFYIALYDEALNEITIHLFYKPGEIVHSDKVENVVRRQKGNGVTEYILHTRKPLLVNGEMAVTAAQLGFEAIGARSKSWMGVPLVIGNRALGVMAMQSFTTPELYDEYQLELFTAVASSAAIALESIRLLQQVQSRARQEQILREVTARVYTAVDAESILRTAAQEINRRLGLETFIYLEEQSQSGQVAELVAANGPSGQN